jgi:hypothetical protein
MLRAKRRSNTYQFLSLWFDQTEARTHDLPYSRRGVRVTRCLVVCVCFVDCYLSLCFFFFEHCVVYPSFFLLTIMLSVLLRYTDSDYPFAIFKLFLHTICQTCWFMICQTCLFMICQTCLLMICQTFLFMICQTCLFVICQTCLLMICQTCLFMICQACLLMIDISLINRFDI